MPRAPARPDGADHQGRALQPVAAGAAHRRRDGHVGLSTFARRGGAAAPRFRRRHPVTLLHCLSEENVGQNGSVFPPQRVRHHSARCNRWYSSAREAREARQAGHLGQVTRSISVTCLERLQTRPPGRLRTRSLLRWHMYRATRWVRLHAAPHACTRTLGHRP